MRNRLRTVREHGPLRLTVFLRTTGRQLAAIGMHHVNRHPVRLDQVSLGINGASVSFTRRLQFDVVRGRRRKVVKFAGMRRCRFNMTAILLTCMIVFEMMGQA
jgi:hypothetical protein